MRLSGDANHRDATPEDLRAAFEKFSPDGEFLILEKAPTEFMQAAPGRIEHRDASGHYVAEVEYSDDLACRLFLSYASGNEWRRMVTWRPITPEELRAERPKGLLVLLVVLVVIAAIVVLQWVF